MIQPLDLKQQWFYCDGLIDIYSKNTSDFFNAGEGGGGGKDP